MIENPLSQFERAAAVADGVIAATRPDQLDHATPCTEWSVRQLINHVVAGNLRFRASVVGGPLPTLEDDHLGDDPLRAFRKAVSGLREALSTEGALDRTYPTPMGERPGAFVVTIRSVEMGLHAWDLAKATDQSTDLDPELAESLLSGLRRAIPADRTGTPFDAEQPVPPGASAADRLAAFAGRKVSQR